MIRWRRGSASDRHAGIHRYGTGGFFGYRYRHSGHCAFGVILYELLTGLRPFDAAKFHRAAVEEIIRMIREEQPSIPSKRLSTSDSLPSLAAARQCDPQRLTRSLRGDLDWIAMKCLEKDRGRRVWNHQSIGRRNSPSFGG